MRFCPEPSKTLLFANISSKVSLFDEVIRPTSATTVGYTHFASLP